MNPQQKDEIAKGFESVAIPKEKQELIYDLSKKKEYHHPLLVNKWARHSRRRECATKNIIKTLSLSYNLYRVKAYHYLGGKINYTKIAKAVGVSVYTVIRYLRLEHKKSRIKGGWNHKSYLRKIELGTIEQEKEQRRKDRLINGKKWRDREKSWRERNPELKKAQDKRKYNKLRPVRKVNCSICGNEFETKNISLARTHYCKNQLCKKEYWKRYMQNYGKDYYKEIKSNDDRYYQLLKRSSMNHKSYNKRFKEKTNNRCSDCGKLISPKSNFCVSCSGKNSITYARTFKKTWGKNENRLF